LIFGNFKSAKASKQVSKQASRQKSHFELKAANEIIITTLLRGLFKIKLLWGKTQINFHFKMANRKVK
jgi:hypothetical protein